MSPVVEYPQNALDWYVSKGYQQNHNSIAVTAYCRKAMAELELLAEES